MLIDARVLDRHLSSSVSLVPLLRTKLAPPQLRPDLVARPRLTQLLNRAAARKCTLVAAPAGFGKTTAVSLWAAHSSHMVAWVALDATDNDPIRFWMYVIAALDTLCAGVGEPALALLQLPQPPVIEAVLGTLLNALHITTEALVLVLDDYHLIDNPAIHRSLAFLLDHLPAHLHLVIASRRDPPLTLARDRASGALIELRAADLRFTVEEVTTLLNDLLGLELDQASIMALVARTEGWIAGLHLVALALPSQENIPNFISALRGSDRYILDYLMDEVLAQQPPALQEFLLQTALLERLSGPLCDAVTQQEHSQNILEQLEYSNLFIEPLDRERRWYRYHQLFAEFLRARLLYLYRERIPAIHHRAAVWYTANQMEAEAIGHALASGDQMLAAQLVDRRADTLVRRGEITTLLGWLVILSEAAFHAYPRLYLIHVWTLLMTGQFEAAESRLLYAETVLKTSSTALYSELLAVRAAIMTIRGDVAGGQAMLAEAEAALTITNIFRQNVMIWMMGFQALKLGQIDTASRTFAQAVSVGFTTGNIASALIAIYGLAQLQLLDGNLAGARALLQRALVMNANHPEPSPCASIVYVGLSKILREQNLLDEAYDAARSGIELGKRWGNLHITIEAYLTLARVQRTQGMYAAAFATIQQAQELLQQVPNHSWKRASVFTERVRLWIAQNDLTPAGHWATIFRESLVHAERAMPAMLFQRDLEELMLVRVLLARAAVDSRAIDEAAVVIGSMIQRAATSQYKERTIEVASLHALVLHARGEHTTAMHEIERALMLAEPGGYVRIFADERIPMLHLLQDYARWRNERGKTEVGQTYLDLIINAIGGPRTRPAIEPPVHAPGGRLSERELEVLHLLATGAATGDIAKMLVIAPGTVKRHLHSIYSKLDARNRFQVIERARALKLVR